MKRGYGLADSLECAWRWMLIFYRSNFIRAEVRRKKSLRSYHEYYGKVLAFLFLYLKQRMLFRPQIPRGKKSGSASSYKETCEKRAE